jgi:hypothetical protein
MSSGFEFMARGLTYEARPITDEARFSFWKAWGITPDFQVALEEQFSRLPTDIAMSELISRSDFLGIQDTR